MRCFHPEPADVRTAALPSIALIARMRHITALADTLDSHASALQTLHMHRQTHDMLDPAAIGLHCFEIRVV